MNGSVGPLTTAPPTIGETATTGAGAGAQRVGHARHREDRADRDDGVGRADDDRPRRGDRLERLGGGRAAAMPSKLDVVDRPLAAARGS